jgi:hypothetical protein
MLLEGVDSEGVYSRHILARWCRLSWPIIGKRVETTLSRMIETTYGARILQQGCSVHVLLVIAVMRLIGGSLPDG